MSKGFTLNKNIYFFRFLFFVLFYFLTYSFSFADGGTVTYTDSSGLNPRSSPSYAGGYTVHTFTATGTTSFTIPLNVTAIDYLVIGGGGGGGVGGGGGGGAGGMLVGNGSTTFYAGQSYTVTVGNGGMGGDAAPNWYGTNGSSSVFGSVTALGGGGGGGNDGAEVGRNGGSGGGAGYGGSAGTGTAGQGYNGGSAGSPQAGGGGGAGEAGSTDSAGYGGDGLQSSISGTATWYAGGGGGRNTGGSSGGTGGGGAEGQNGTNGTGGGGGGYFPTRGDGGSGIVIIRYLTPDSNLAVLATSTSVSYVTESSATFSGSLISIGGASVTSRGICYGTTRYPTNCVAEGGTATGDFSITLSNLATSTTYFYRSYATNSYGTSTSADGVFTTEGLTNSIMFDSAQSQYLNRTFSTATDGKKWTYSFWVKRSMLYAQNNIQFVLATAGSGAQGFIGFGQANNSDEISFGYGGYVRRYTSALFRDPSAWQHIVLTVDTATTTEANRAIFYVNGVQANMVTPNTITQNDTTQINQAVSTLIGNQTGQAYGRFDGYLSDVNFVDGQALTPSYFGKSDSNTGNWIPKAYQGTYGANGFHLNFSSSTALGYDTAPIDSTHTATNTWTTNGGMSSTTNQVIDTPINNFATLNPVDSSGTAVIANGSLQIQTAAKGRKSTFFVSSGKWAWEIHFSSTMSGVAGIGIADASTNMDTWTGGNYVLYRADGGKQVNGSYGGAYGASYTNGDVIRIEYNADASTIEFFKQTGGSGSFISQGTLAVTAGTYSPTAAIGATSGIIIFNFGQFPFLSTPTTGFKPLSTANLPTPTILKPNQYFDVVTYTGNGGTKTISTSFDSDFVWVKNRSAAYSNVLNDRVRGNDKTLVSDSNTAESALTGYMNFESLGSKQITFNYSGSGGPTGEWNYPGHNFVAWNWKAGGATTTNTNGAITSTVSANQTAGFSIAKFILNVANGASISWGHGLSSTPEMIIYKRTNSADSWLVYHTSVDANPNNYYLTLNSTNAKSNVNGWSAPATTTVGGINNWQNGDTVVAYSFDEIPGYSKFGSYTGNGSADGPFVYTGFKPKYIMLKRTDASYHWYVWDSVRDTYNPYTHELLPSSSSAEYVNSPELDALSNGFKLRGTFADLNANGGTFIYAAFAESIMIPIVASSTSSSSSTITPPSDVTVTPGNGQATIDYTISPTSNFTEILVLRSNQDITDVPTDGVDYSVGNAIGSASVGCVDSTISTSTENVFDSCVATGLSNSTLYYFKVYSKDASGNYSLIQSVEGASTTPSVGATAVTVTSYRLRKDDGGEVTANYSHSENTPMNTGFISGDKRRIRFVVSNQTASLTKKRYQLEYAVTPCSSWTVLPKANEATNQHFRMDLSPFVPDNSTTTRSNGVTAPNGKTFVPGRIQTFNNLTYPIVLRENQFTEVEYSVRATNNVALNTSYCFRATGYGDAADFTYTNTPQISSLSTAYRYQGGGTGGSQLSSVSILKIEDPTVVATTSQTGGDQGGTAVSTSTTVEATSTPASQQSTTTPTRKRGGGGATGYEPPKNNYAYSAVKDSLTFMNLFIKELANYQLKSTAINAYAYQECNLKTLVFIKTGECEHLDMYGDNKSKINLNILWSVFNKIEEIGK